jgi:hypothetical protein
VARLAQRWQLKRAAKAAEAEGEAGADYLGLLKLARQAAGGADEARKV